MAQRFLIIDDDRISRLRLRGALEGLGECEIREVTNLALARTALASGEFTAVFCDLLLPDGDGFSLLSELPRAGASRFVYTCRVNAETRARAGELGATFLEKPLVEAELRAALQPLVAVA